MLQSKNTCKKHVKEYAVLRINTKKIRIALLCTLLLSMVALLALSYDTIVGNAPHAQYEFPHEKLDADTQDFSTHLPIIVIQTDVSRLFHGSRNYPIHEPPAAVIWLFDNDGYNQLVHTPTEVFVSATANYRGHVSLRFQKRGYMLNLYNHKAFYRPLNHNFFGLSYASEWVLRAPYSDKSLLRDWFAYELAASVLAWQPQGRPVELFIQDGESGEFDYQGVYFFCENISVGETRLNLENFNLSSS
jgi:hypothetical protein